MKISNLDFYGGSREKVCRLGLAHLFLELQEILISTRIRILDRKQENGAGRVRELINERFREYEDWIQSKSGDIDWVKRLRFNQTIVSRLGVEVQVSGRSDLLARDIVHIRNNLQDSHIDAGVIVVPSDAFEYFLTDRVANYSYAVRYVEEELREAQSYPIILIAVEHDGFSDEPLPKKMTNKGKKS
uniref:Restriction endonuclease BglII n=1 Tax=Candidatus Kentrum eta TaxID=2126337 RepID=A0A450USV8_9GAMM|nr:MAG: Restriction endonuclease BglII [Candidatus Kentron sp. H]VFJ96537.1 MAG: Restriction endonuclease BglII [Candidatus Kentron sp. H]VFK02455.1 MAG: Restriction endonuclease BglII [Candidatus Kentron sp. H]